MLEIVKAYGYRDVVFQGKDEHGEHFDVEGGQVQITHQGCEIWYKSEFGEDWTPVDVLYPDYVEELEYEIA